MLDDGRRAEKNKNSKRIVVVSVCMGLSDRSEQTKRNSWSGRGNQMFVMSLKIR